MIEFTSRISEKRTSELAKVREKKRSVESRELKHELLDKSLHERERQFPPKIISKGKIVRLQSLFPANVIKSKVMANKKKPQKFHVFFFCNAVH